MLMVQDRNKLLNRFKVLLNRGTEVKLYRELPHASNVASIRFSGHMGVANVYRSLVKALDKAKKTKRKEDYAAFAYKLKDKAAGRMEESVAAFLEASAVESLAMNKEALESGFRKVYGHSAIVIVPDKFWQETATDAIGAIGRFNKVVEGVVDASFDDDRFKDIVEDAGAAMTRRIGNEGFLVQSRTARRVQEYAGVSRYVWLTMKDNRVVGNPVGLYPVGTADHGDHWERDGKVFSWSEPPHDGHPGEAYGCRCQAIPLMGLGNSEIR
jgi:hypothetical protein